MSEVPENGYYVAEHSETDEEAVSLHVGSCDSLNDAMMQCEEGCRVIQCHNGTIQTIWRN